MEATTTIARTGRLFPLLSGMAKGLLGWLVAGLLGAVAASSAPGAEPVSKEYQIKAAFLYNFANFVQWPEQSFADADSPIVIGVLGSSPFGTELDKAIRGRSINGHRLVAIVVQTPAAARQAHLLFVAVTEDSKLDELKAALGGAPVLTVGEAPAFARQGGMITFVLRSDKLRFEINVGTAQKAGLKISAQLQKLATEIRR